MVWLLRQPVSCARVKAPSSALVATMLDTAPKVSGPTSQWRFQRRPNKLLSVIECQKLDWKFHKRICPSFDEVKPTITDPNGSIDGIVFDYMPILTANQEIAGSIPALVTRKVRCTAMVSDRSIQGLRSTWVSHGLYAC